MKNKFNKVYLVLLILLIISLGATGYFIYQNYELKKYKMALENELLQTKLDFASTTENLKAVIDLTEQKLSNAKIARDLYEQKYIEEHNMLNSLAEQIQGIQSKVGILEKLSQTYPELLKKYSKVYFLNENYVPETFVKIDSHYTYDPSKDYLIYSKIWLFLRDLMAQAEVDNIDIKIISAYRSFGAQSDLKSTYKMVYGSGANKFSADQGYSEHQLGTTLDFTTSKIGAPFTGFEKTPAFQWLSDNAYKYGFILSYPENNTYYQFEPWHWRFVGRALADKLHQDGKNFYDLDQRDIDSYLIYFFDY